MRFCRRFFVTNQDYKTSYSQSGEDLIIRYIFDLLKVARPSYLDIGAYDPVSLSNTYLFYRLGCRGVCVEPNPVLHAAIKKKRPHDICLNVGVGRNQETRADFYLMTSKTLSTFSKQEAETLDKQGHTRIEDVIQVPLVSSNDIIKDYLGISPDFVSLDVEGMDLPVLQSFDFSTYRPMVFCVETLTYSEDNSEKKITAISDLMISNGYSVYADTYINTIFVDMERWRKRPSWAL